MLKKSQRNKFPTQVTDCTENVSYFSLTIGVSEKPRPGVEQYWDGDSFFLQTDGLNPFPESLLRPFTVCFLAQLLLHLFLQTGHKTKIDVGWLKLFVRYYPEVTEQSSQRSLNGRRGESLPAK